MKIALRKNKKINCYDFLHNTYYVKIRNSRCKVDRMYVRNL